MAYLNKKTDLEKEDKGKELLEKIENGLKEFLNSDKYKEFLKIQSKFHGYSLNNTIAIIMQKPEASRIAGYKTWQKLGRQVNKGEKGIKILAPNPFKFEKEVDKVDPITKQPIRDEKGNILKENKTVEGRTFKVISVFDISQTSGKDLPEICKELTGNSVNAENLIKSIKNISTIPILEENITNGSKGYYDRAFNKIAYKSGMSLDQTAKTLVHEYAHALLHNKDSFPNLPRETKEVQAESTAYIVSEHFGLDTSEYSFGYITSWSSNKEFPELKDTFDLINKTASDIINKIESYLENSVEIPRLQNPNIPQHITNRLTLLEQYGNVLPINSLTDKTIESIIKINKMDNELKSVDFLLNNCPTLKNEINVLQKEKIINTYSNEFPAIKFVSYKTVDTLTSINEKNNNITSIKEIKDTYKKLGKEIEAPENINNKELLNSFKDLSDVVNDFKQANIQLHNETTKVLTKNVDIEMSI